MEKNVVGNQDDWANYVTLADEHETPLLRLLPKGKAPVGVVKHYQADTYDAPVDSPWPDGKDWDTFKSAGANRVELQSRIQWFVETAAVSKLAEDVTDVAGISDELAHEIPKKLTEMARRMECAAGSDQAAYADDGQVGHRFRGIGKWISATWTSDADSDVPAAVLPSTTGQVTTTATASATEATFRTMFQAMWSQTGATGRKIGVVGSTVKNIFTGFQYFAPNLVPWTGTAAGGGRSVTLSKEGGAIGGGVSVYNSDWGTIELHMTKFNAAAGFTGGSAAYSPLRGYFLNAARWEWCWKQKPKVYRPEFAGGGYKAAMDAIIMLLCKNPQGEGKYAPTA